MAALPRLESSSSAYAISREHPVDTRRRGSDTPGPATTICRARYRPASFCAGSPACSRIRAPARGIATAAHARPSSGRGGAHGGGSRQAREAAPGDPRYSCVGCRCQPRIRTVRAGCHPPRRHTPEPGGGAPCHRRHGRARRRCGIPARRSRADPEGRPGTGPPCFRADEHLAEHRRGQHRGRGSRNSLETGAQADNAGRRSARELVVRLASDLGFPPAR